MKLKDLIFNREKLRKYDELTEWKDNFENIVKLPMAIVPRRCIVGVQLPDHIKQIIVSALEAEIKKLDEQ